MSLSSAPVISFDLDAIRIPLMSIPGLEGLISSLCSKGLAESIVLPMKTVIPLEPLSTLERLSVCGTAPMGVLRVHVISASGLRSVDNLGGISDPYASLHVSNDRKKNTKPVPQCLDPVWDECFEWLIWDPTNNFLSIVVKDEELLGR